MIPLGHRISMRETTVSLLEGLLLEFDLDSELAQLRRPQINLK